MKQHYYFRMIVPFFIIILLFIVACDKDPVDSETPEGDLLEMLEQAVADENIPGAILGVKTPSDTWLLAAGTADIASAKLIQAIDFCSNHETD